MCLYAIALLSHIVPSHWAWHKPELLLTLPPRELRYAEWYLCAVPHRRTACLVYSYEAVACLACCYSRFRQPHGLSVKTQKFHKADVKHSR